MFCSIFSSFLSLRRRQIMIQRTLTNLISDVTFWRNDVIRCYITKKNLNWISLERTQTKQYYTHSLSGKKSDSRIQCGINEKWPQIFYDSYYITDYFSTKKFLTEKNYLLWSFFKNFELNSCFLLLTYILKNMYRKN